MVEYMDLNKFREEALSILKPWKDNNKKKVKEYLSNHEWLRADVLKLENWIKDNKIVLLAITDKFIYGINDTEMICSVGRGTLGIADNFKGGNNMKINLNARILEVLCMVHHYKCYRSAMASLYPEQKINWFEDTRKFYFGLDLPKGLNKNEIDFERVMQFHPDSKPYREWMETNEDELDKFVWKNW